MAIEGIVGKISGGTSIVNAFLVALQKVNYDVQSTDNVAFLFATRGEDVVELKSDITDHYIEDNTAIQDQIALKPKEITLHGYIGELTNTLPGILDRINRVVSRLTVLSPYVPQLTTAALTQYNQARQVYNSLASAATSLVQAYNMVKGNDLQTLQMKAYGYFERKFDDRALFKVTTPWRVFENMAIVSLRAVQSEEDATISDFVIQFKQMRFADTLASDLSIVQGRRAAQVADTVNRGFQNPPATASLGELLSGQGVQGTVFGS